MLRWTQEEAEEYSKRTGMKVPVNKSAKKTTDVTTSENNKTVLPQKEEPLIPVQLTPKQRTQALGRLNEGEMNATEKAYKEHLKLRLKAGEVLWFGFEKIKVKLARRTYYTADFTVLLANGAFEFHEVKGHWEEDARVKIKVAAEQFPFRFIGVKKDGDNWIYEDFSPWFDK